VALGEIYIKLTVSFPNDPKVRALARYGADAGLARDLYVQMCLYCKDLLTDGFVPTEQIGLLVYPLDLEHGNQLAKQLASVGLIKEVSNRDTQGWLVLAFVKRNGTRDDVERLSQVRADAGRKGGRPPRKPAGQGTGKPTGKPNGNQLAKQTESRPNPYTESETDSETENALAEVDNQSSGRNARATEDLVIQRVQQVIYDVTSRPIDALWADWIRSRIASIAKDDDLGPAYFETVIRSEPDPVGRFLEDEPPPPWCGECNQYRRLEHPDTGADLGPCPDCHPSLRKEPA